jgi:hypothetical protein
MANISKALQSDLGNQADSLEQAARRIASAQVQAQILAQMTPGLYGIRRIGLSPSAYCPACSGSGRVRSDHYLRTEAQDQNAPERECFACKVKEERKQNDT